MWEYEVKAGSDTYKAYPYDVNSKLEQAYKAHSKTAEWTDGSVKYVVDLNSYTEKIKGLVGHGIKVRRTEKGKNH